MDALCHRSVKKLARRFWERTCADASLIIIPTDSVLLHGAANLFAHREDKDWSLTDCMSFVIMEDRKITLALTGDHHFEQAGFQIYFRS